MRILFFAFLIVYIGCPKVNSIRLECQYITQNLQTVGWVYRCLVQEYSDLVFIPSNRNIDVIAGSHHDNKTNDDVKAVMIDRSNVFYLPRGLGEKFVNLEFLEVVDTFLKEIRSEDLRQFPNLLHLDLKLNDYQVLEANLFQFNPKIKFFALGKKILHIDPNIFDNFIDKVSWLSLAGIDDCGVNKAENNIEAVNQLIQKVQSGFCTNQDKLAEFFGQTTTRRTTSTTTPIPTASTISTTTSTTVNCCVAIENQLREILSKIDFVSIKMEDDLKAVEEKLTYDLHEVNYELSNQILKIPEYQNRSNVTDQCCQKVVNIFV